MKRYLQIAAIVGVLAIVAAACGGSSSSGPTSGGSGSSAAPVKGGTLHAVMTQDFFHGLDPTAEYYSVSWEFLRCCMARTLVNYNGKPTDEGGATPRPDLATDMPTQSSDGMTWTFHIKDGVMFGDPLNREITADDFVNSINRLADPAVNTSGYPFYYTDIVGFSDVENGKVKPLHDGGPGVSGVKAVDAKTFEVDLTKPNQDIPYLFSMSATAPLPKELTDAHYAATELGQFLVSSGPYEWQGMTPNFNLNGSKPPSGMNIGKSYVFVRNPSYDPSTDGLRPAYLDQMEIQVGGEVQDLLDKVDAGAVDWCIDCGATATTLQKYASDPSLYNPQDPSTCDPQPCRLQIWPQDATSYIGLNTLQPPFDDVHVRAAVNWATNKDALWRLAGGPVAGVIAGHFVPSTMMNGLLSDYNPFATPNNQGDPQKAMDEMKQSKYDTNGDGVCDAGNPACTVQALTVSGDNDAIKGMNILNESFAPIGIKLDIKTLSYNALVTKCSTLASHTAFCGAAWGKDYPSPYTYFFPLLDGCENGSNYSFTGCTEAQITKAGYQVPADGIPTIHDQINKCHDIPVGPDQDSCWAELDKYVTETLVTQIDRRFYPAQDVLGSRFTAYSYDQFAGVGDPSQMALAPGSS
jgi:peptide/nickel transport system substrate-binding protein